MTPHPEIESKQWHHIQSELERVEAEHDIRIIFAVESGSRAWGFPSPDSDYDVRFVYAHPRDWYLSLAPGRDVIEIPLEGDDDISGWDIRKALSLALKPNPVLLEWLSSPIQYLWNEAICDELQNFTRTIGHGSACRYHYMRMATLQRGDGETIKLKKYFYALRSAMALRWIETHQDAPPMNFQTLVAGVNIASELRGVIDDLLKRKRETIELGIGQRIPIIEDFLDREIAIAQAAEKPRANMDEATQHRRNGDVLFRSILEKIGS